MFRLCFVWVYIIKGEIYPLCEACEYQQALFGVHFCMLMGEILPLPEVVLHKRESKRLLRVLLSYNFLRQCAVLSLLISGRLEMTDQLFKQARQRSKTGLAIGLFCGAIFQVLHSKIEYFRIRIRVEVNPYVGEIFTRIFLFPIGKEMCLCRKK